MAQSTINPTIPVANAALSSAPIRSQFQAAANDINNIFTLINAYPQVTQKTPNLYIGPTGQMLRSATGIPISMTNIWSLTAHDGVSEFYTTPTYVPNFNSTAYSGPAIVFQGWDWYIYAVNALTGALLTGFPVATAGPCYGRVVAANVDTGGYSGMTLIMGCTHGGNQGTGGQVIALHSDGTSAWVGNNVYADEGGNDMHASVSQGTPTTLSAAITTTGQTAISVTSGANITNQGQIMIGTEVMLVTAGGGTSSLTVTRGYNNTTAATHLISAVVNTGHPTLGGTTSTGLALSGGSDASATVSGTNPAWPTNAWTREEGAGFGATVAVVAGTGAGQQIECSGVTGGNQINFVGTLSTALDATSVIQMLPRYTSDVTIQHAGTLNVESGVTYLYTTADDNTLMKRNATTGAKQWRYWSTENNEPFPLIAPVTDGLNNSVLFNSIDGYTYCLTLAGALVWKTLGVAGVGLDSYLAAANISNSGAYLNVVVNQRRSGNAAAGRTYVLRGDTGAKVSCSGDQLGDCSSGPLLIPRTDGSGKYYVFSASNATLCTLFDDQMNGLWRYKFADNSNIDQFRSTPFLADVNYDGVNEIISCSQNSGTINIFSQNGPLLATITPPALINSATHAPNADFGIEGTPCTFLNGGLLNMIIPSKDGTISCWQFNQNAG